MLNQSKLFAAMPRHFPAAVTALLEMFAPLDNCHPSERGDELWIF